MKICASCKVEKPIDNFYKYNRKGKKPSFQSYCIPCNNAIKTKWSANNYNRIRVWKIKNIYNLSEKDFYKLIDSQNCKCALCDKELERSTLSKSTHIDHCHDTGIVRGILCSVCNTQLGIYEKLKKNPKVENYLRNTLP